MALDLDPFPGVGSRSLKDSFEPWNVKKTSILRKFTTQEKMTITTSVFATEHGTLEVYIMQLSLIQVSLLKVFRLCNMCIDVRGVSEKVLHRLEQLDLDTGSKQTFGGLTQEEYTHKVNYHLLTIYPNLHFVYDVCAFILID